MRDDTAIGGGDGRFPATRWSLIERARSDDAGQRELAFEALVEGYWKPIYKHLRLRWRRSNEDAKDLTQDFLVSMLEKRFLDGYDPAAARLRTYVRVCLDRFVQNHDRAARRLKRGGAVALESLDFSDAERELRAGSLAAGAAAEEPREREWPRQLFARAVEALETDCRSRNRELDFMLFARYDLEDDAAGAPTYASLAAETGVSVPTVTNRLASVRRRFRSIVLETLRESTASEADFRREARALLGWEG